MTKSKKDLISDKRRIAGKLGGQARALALTPDRRKEIAKLGAAARKRWSAKQLEQIERDAEMFLSKMKPLPTAEDV